MTPTHPDMLKRADAMDLLRRLVEWNDRGDCRSLSDFVEEARHLLTTAGVTACDPTKTECPRCNNDPSKCDGTFGVQKRYEGQTNG